MERGRVGGRVVDAIAATCRAMGRRTRDRVVGVRGRGNRERGRERGREAGMATAEYAIATLAAAAFAGVLLVVVRSGEVRDLVTGIVRQALSV